MHIAMGIVHGNGEDAPGIVEQGVDHGYTQPGQSDDDDEEDYDRRYAAGDLADILFGDDRQGLSLVAIGCEKNNHVMNAPAKTLPSRIQKKPGPQPYWAAKPVQSVAPHRRWRQNDGRKRSTYWWDIILAVIAEMDGEISCRPA